MLLKISSHCTKLSFIHFIYFKLLHCISIVQLFNLPVKPPDRFRIDLQNDATICAMSRLIVRETHRSVSTPRRIGRNWIRERRSARFSIRRYTISRAFSFFSFSPSSSSSLSSSPPFPVLPLSLYLYICISIYKSSPIEYQQVTSLYLTLLCFENLEYWLDNFNYGNLKNFIVNFKLMFEIISYIL